MKKTYMILGMIAILSISMVTGAALQQRYKIIPFLDVEDLSVRDDAIFADQVRIDGNLHLEGLEDGVLCLEGNTVKTSCGAS